MNGNKMLFKIFTGLCFVLLLNVSNAYSQQFTREQFYKTMAGKSVNDIDEQITVLKNNPVAGKDAFEGVLLMKKADLIESKKEKLKLFKSGKTKLEAVIAKDTSNAEFRFLRLQIQEHAPKVVKYRDKLESDKVFIIRSFKGLSPEMQQVILDYSKQSKILQPADL